MGRMMLERDVPSEGEVEVGLASAAGRDRTQNEPIGHAVAPDTWVGWYSWTDVAGIIVAKVDASDTDFRWHRRRGHDEIRSGAL